MTYSIVGVLIALHTDDLRDALVCISIVVDVLAA